MKKFLILIFIFLSAGFLYSGHVRAELLQDKVATVKAKVLEATPEQNETIAGNVRGKFQQLKVQILEGSEKGKIIMVEDDYINLSKGDTFFLNITQPAQGKEFYSVADANRLPYILVFGILFLATILYFGRMQGLRAILSLAGSFLIIFYLFIPHILDGDSPVLTSVIISIIMITMAIYITHGVNREATAALVSTVMTIFFAIVLSHVAIKITKLTGFATEESMYLNIATSGKLDFQGLLLGSFIIGALGALYDIAVTQVYAIRELYNSAGHLSKKEIYDKGLRIGREHIGALINTLALAYLGVAMPLILLFSSSNYSLSPLLIINKEIFATEIIRTIIGSVCLVLVVPISTLLGVNMIVKKKVPL